jgi:hypothetical protein
VQRGSTTVATVTANAQKSISFSSSTGSTSPVTYKVNPK